MGLAGASILLGVCLAQTGGAGAAEGPREPWRDWTTLRMKAHGVPLFGGQLEMHRPDSRRLTTSAVARFLGAPIARSRTETVFDAEGRSARHVRESKKHARRYRFDSSGYTAEKLAPDGDRDAPVDTWEVVATDRFPLPEGSPRIYDYYGMLLRLSREPLREVGDSVSLLVATSQGPEAFTVSVAETRRSERSFKDAASGTQCALTIDELRLRVVPANPDSSEAGFMDMEGDIEIWVEADSKTPVEIRGRIPRVGRIVLELVELG